ncbi:MAG: hypothetical protein EOO15_11725 [Chitinophagaceae bacterium]|nr:MAG: hypothetical protein EOO15_11725 [Chitinophagaceae bacterium]
MKDLPLILPIVFLLVVLVTAFALARAAHFRRPVVIGICGWLLLQSAVSITGFYTDFRSLPPRLFFLLGPPVIFIAILLATAKGRSFLDSLEGRVLTLLHTVRIPVEAVLWGLALYKTIPVLITFEGINFDIFSGISAPLAYYFAFSKGRGGRKGLLVWNIVCLALLVNVVGHAILSFPTPFQQLSFHQPAIAVGYFPYTLLPGFVVPVVLLAHVAMIRRLIWKAKPGWALAS